MLNTTSINNWDTLDPCSLFDFFGLNYVAFSLIRKIEILGEIILCALHTHISYTEMLNRTTYLIAPHQYFQLF